MEDRVRNEHVRERDRQDSVCHNHMTVEGYCDMKFVEQECDVTRVHLLSINGRNKLQ